MEARVTQLPVLALVSVPSFLAIAHPRIVPLHVALKDLSVATMLPELAIVKISTTDLVVKTRIALLLV
jgi:hypothetical protein